MRQTIRFEPNKPVTVALQFPEGVNVRGFSGLQVRYYLTENRIMYLDEEPAKALKILNPKPGEPFTVVKRTESGKRPWWEVERVKGGGAADKNTPGHSSRATVAVGAPASPTTAAPIKIEPQPAHAVARGTGTDGPAPRPQLTRTPPRKPSYEEAFRECIRIVQTVLKESGEQWSDEARQAMVSTLLIQAGRENAIRFEVREVA